MGKSLSRHHPETSTIQADGLRGDRCHTGSMLELGYSMGDLDELAKTKGYFRQAGWTVRGKPNYRAIGRVVEALDGELSICWREE